jgi:cysteinyl-tRNA synthetase
MFRKGLEFSPDSVHHAKSILRKLESFVSDSDAICRGLKRVKMVLRGEEIWESLNRTRKLVKEALMNDFDTPCAIQAISDFIDSFNRAIVMESGSDVASYPVDYGVVLSSSSFLRDFLSIVGLEMPKVEQNADTSKLNRPINSGTLLEELVRFRSQVRNHALAFDEVNDPSYIIFLQNFTVYTET